FGMCGIIAVLRRASGRPVPASAEVLRLLEAAPLALANSGGLDGALADAAASVGAADALLRGVPGTPALLRDRTLGEATDRLLARLAESIETIELRLDSDGPTEGLALEATNAAIIRLKDAVWAVQRDRLRTARAVADLAGSEPGDAKIAAFTSVQVAL